MIGAPRLDALVVSPHPDDAVFSTGGAIALDVRAGRRVAVATVFTRLADGDEARADEDRRAIARLGAERIELGLDEAPVRDPRCRRPAALLGALDPAIDGPVIAAATERLRAIVRARGVRILVGPLGVGEHRDHQAVHAALASLDGEAGLDVAYYEDLPYAFARRSVERRLARLGDGAGGRWGWPSEIAAWWGRARYFARLPLVEEAAGSWPVALVAGTIALASPPRPSADSSTARARSFIAEDVAIADGLDDKLAAIGEYASQWPLFARSLDEWRRRLAEHATASGAACVVERRWRRAR